MAEFIKVNGQEYPATCVYIYKDRNWDMRDTQTVHLTMPYAQAAALLTTGTPWFNVTRETVDKLDNDGNPTGQTEEVMTEEDMSAYSLAGQITDYRDGTVSIKMGKPTETETSAATVTALVGQSITPQRAVELRPVIEAAAVSLPDNEAAAAVELFPAWEYPHDYVVGDRVNDISTNKLYKCVQAHTSQALWEPAATPALWVVIDVTHAGTQDDPIPAARGMEYTYGFYYKDPEDTKLYLCERTGEQSGNKITLQYLPHELAGQYFTAVSA